MLLALLVHLLIFHLLNARDDPPHKDTKYIIKHIDTCPDVGYYFKKESAPNSINPGVCYLCFCQGDNTAVCWKRDNTRCNVESFNYHGVGKRDTRIRRSPGFADIFFRDAARDVFNKNSKTQCKPFESSFSDDCPPADWCTGCTVCDCDAHGHWDCHLLSFCTDNKDKKKSKRKGSMRKVVAKKPVKKPKTSSSRMPKRTPPHSVKKTNNKAKTKITPQIKRGGDNKNPQHKRIVKKSVPLKTNMTPGPRDRRTAIRYRRIAPFKTDATKEMIIKKNIATHSPIDIKTTKVNLEMEIAQKVMKKVMSNLRKSINGEMKNISKIANDAVKKNNSVKKNVRNMKKTSAKPKPKPKPAKKVTKRQIKKPQIKPKKPTKKPVKNYAGKPTRKPPPTNYVRHKRDVSTAPVGDNTTIVPQAKPEDTTNSTTAFSMIPVTSNLLIPDDDNCSHTPERSTLPENEYYKYVVGSEDPKLNVSGDMEDKSTTQVNKTETILNLISTEKSSIVSTEKSDINKAKANKITNSTEINPEANDLKYSKWSHLKILKEKKFNSGFDKHKSLVKIISHQANKTIPLGEHKNKVHGKNVERKLNSRKYNIVKLLNHPKCKIKRDKKRNNTNVQMANKKIGNLQHLLSNILREFHRNSTVNSPKRNRKFSVLRYLKRIFNKIFKRKKTPDQFSKHHLIETLCENFGPCKISRKDKALLNKKLTDLDEETTKILKTVHIIKGLLKLVELPKNSDSDSSRQDNFRSDIQKLNNILKGVYGGKNVQVALSATQLTQIEYIKRNTQDFIQSVNNFASLLNEIIAILTKHDTNASKNSNRIIRNSLINKNLTKNDPFQGLKNLLVRYNLIQNSFMKRMYEQLNNFENKMNEKPKVSEINKDFNNSVAIENFSRNIIQNLRKLKRLAQTVSYSGRAKRETQRDDDAIEYLLMLMEYLLKQNHPLDAAPVNDGIDLLIEAIKNAPDIKPIKKKVLEYTPATYADSTTTPFPISVTTEGTSSDDDSPSDSDKTSSEDSGRLKLEDTEDNLKNKMEENKDLVEIIAEDDKDPEDKYQYDRRAGIDKLDEITEMTFYNRIDDNIVLEPDAGLESTTIMALEMELGDKLDNQDDINMEKPLAIETNNLDKPTVRAGGEGVQKFEALTGDMDEELFLSETTLITTSESPSTITTEHVTQAKKSKNKMRHRNLESYVSENVDKKSKLEWIEENFGKENDKEVTNMEENNTTLHITVTPETISTQTIDKIDISSLSRESADEDKEKKKAKLNAEDVMLRKQMDLLNSLDYGTEKAELYESDSKDGNTEDRYSSDLTFPSYFV